MRKVILVFVGVVLISFGAIDWAVGVLMPHSRVIIFLGAVAVAAAGFIHGWQRLQKKITLPMMTVITSPLEHAFDPTKPPQVLQWNPNAVSGVETWLWILLIAAGLGLFYWGLSRFLGGVKRY